LSVLTARLDRIPFSFFHVRLLVMGGLGYVFDAMDVAIVAFVLPVLKVQWHLDSKQIGVLAAAAAIGGVFGGLFAGYIGDAIGRRSVMVWALALYCVASLGSALAPGWKQFLAWRVIAGVG
jgi:MFS transporter, putative metabolite:H+ symporter